MWFGFSSCLSIGVTSTFGCIPKDVVFTMMSVVSKICFKDSEL